MTAVEALRDAGCALLAPVLEPAGFTLAGVPSSEPARALARFARGDRALDLVIATSERPSRDAWLRDVTYRRGDASVSHDRYMTVVLGEEGSNQYPTFGGAPLDAFRHLAHDLAHYGVAFLRGPDAHFDEIVTRAREFTRGRWAPLAAFRT